jgi:hypothetical protein
MGRGLSASQRFVSCAATSGNTAAPSILTASSAFGSRPSALTIVGATCRVVVAERDCLRVEHAVQADRQDVTNPAVVPVVIVLRLRRRRKDGAHSEKKDYG